jgi:serine/threonine protein kinase
MCLVGYHAIPSASNSVFNLQKLNPFLLPLPNTKSSTAVMTLEGGTGNIGNNGDGDDDADADEDEDALDEARAKTQNKGRDKNRDNNRDNSTDGMYRTLILSLGTSVVSTLLILLVVQRFNGSTTSSNQRNSITNGKSIKSISVKTSSSISQEGGDGGDDDEGQDDVDAEEVDDDHGGNDKANTSSLSSSLKKRNSSSSSSGVSVSVTDEKQSSNNNSNNKNKASPTRAIMSQTPHGRTMKLGKMEILLESVLGTGSRGTVVFAGYFEGRPVAIKRMLRPFFGESSADQEISLLIDSDQHPNVVRYYSKEDDADFIYLALERCASSLTDLVTDAESESSTASSTRQYKYDSTNTNANANTKYPNSSSDGSQSNSNNNNNHNNNILSDDNQACCPERIHQQLRRSHVVPITSFEDMKQVLLNVLAGIAHLHALNIVHRDIKPCNILLTKDGKGKLADMGLGKKLDMLRSSFDSMVSGTIGWQPKELIAGGRLTKSVDIFSAGCVVYYMLSKGRHPFGLAMERQMNIMGNKYVLTALEYSHHYNCMSTEEELNMNHEDVIVPSIMQTSGITSASSKVSHINGASVGNSHNQNNPEHSHQIIKILSHDYHLNLRVLGWAAQDLVTNMIQFEPYNRLTAVECINHPFFWPAEKRLQFLCDVSDRFENEPVGSTLRNALELNAQGIVSWRWDQSLAPKLLSDLGVL